MQIHTHLNTKSLSHTHKTHIETQKHATEWHPQIASHRQIQTKLTYTYMQQHTHLYWLTHKNKETKNEKI